MQTYWHTQICRYPFRMLSRKYIKRIAQMDAQYGPPEQTFSPRWHADQARNGPDPVILNRTTTEHSRVVRVILGNVADPQTGDVRIQQYASIEERDANPNCIVNERKT